MFFVSQGSCRVGPVKALGRALTVDLRRALVSGRFLLTVGLLLLWQLFNCSGTLLSANEWTESSVVYAFNFAISNQEVLADLLLPLAALPYAWSFLQDRESGFELQAVERVGARAYGLAKLLSVGAAAFLAVAAAMFLFLAGLYAMGMETLPGYPLNNNQHYAIASAGHVGLFYLVRITIAGLTGSLAAVFALTVSSFLSNSYVALLAPLLGFYTSQVLHSLLIPRLSAFRLDFVFFYQPIAGSASFSFLWSAVYLLTLTALCARLFLWRLRKEAGE